MSVFTRFLMLAVLGWTASVSLEASATTFQVLYSFAAGAGGTSPYAPVIIDKAGSVYGTTYTGGSSGKACPENPYSGNGAGCGVVFKLTPPGSGSSKWTEKVLHSFQAKDGALPWSRLLMDGAGAIFGAAAYGDITCSVAEFGIPAGCGAIFKLTPPAAGKPDWTETVLHGFAGGTKDGATPFTALVMDSSGALYGATNNGGSADSGVVFKLTPPKAGKTAWTETVLHGFTGLNGASPSAAPLILGAGGTLYGTTVVGGGTGNCPVSNSPSCGVVYKLSPPAGGKTAWTETILHRFTNNNGGGYLLGGLVMDKSGAFYGTASSGGETSSVCPGKFVPRGCGVVFKLTPPLAGKSVWTETVLHIFDGRDGALPEASVVMDKSGALYGTTLGGGTAPHCAGNRFTLTGCGTVFKLSPPAHGKTTWTETVLHSFTGGKDGGVTNASLSIDKLGALYGTTLVGGKGFGVVFRVTP